MPKASAKKSGKKPAPAPYDPSSRAKGGAAKESQFTKKTKIFSIGGDIPPTTNMSRYTKFPRNVRHQRAKAILYQRIKTPPSIASFQNTLDKNTMRQAVKLLHKYRPETKAEKKERLTAQAEAKVSKKDAAAAKKPFTVKYGLNHITGLVEQKKAQLVLIASDVDPIELVVWLPALCRKMQVPYAIVKNKAVLGTLVHKKTATAVALTGVRPEDKNELAKIVDAVKSNYNDRFDETRRRWGGGIMGTKSQHKAAAKQAALEKEAAQKAGL